MRERFVREYGLSEYDAQTLTGVEGTRAYFEGVAATVTDKKVAANWVMGELSAALNESAIAVDIGSSDSRVSWQD